MKECLGGVRMALVTRFHASVIWRPMETEEVVDTCRCGAPGREGAICACIVAASADRVGAKRACDPFCTCTCT
jgi:hypothetical protein